MTISLLMLSNGHGEDAMGALMARRLILSEQGIQVTAAPVVGEGLAYRDAGIRVVGVQRMMPSGGFIWKGATNLVKDLGAGLIGLTVRQVRELRRLRREVDWIVAVGDVYVLALAGCVMNRPTVFIPTAKTEYIHGHYSWEYALMRRYAELVFPRDEKTAHAMHRKDVAANYAGNLMMDALEVTGSRFGLSTTHPVVGILPGSREEAYANACDILSMVETIQRRHGPYHYILALAPGLSMERLHAGVAGQGWRLAHPEDAALQGGVVGSLINENRVVLCVQGEFGDVIDASDIVIGMSGTGNEQAAGTGRPVVAFPGEGAQFTPRFAADQKRLLGEALSLVPRDPQAVADEIARILAEPDLYALKAQAGRDRMGSPGALERMTKEIAALIGRSGPHAGRSCRHDA